MIRELVWKPDFSQTVDRFAAWWSGDVLDRPPVTMTVNSASPAPIPPYEKMLDGHFLSVRDVVDAEIDRLSQFDYVGDTYPIFRMGLGPELTSTLFIEEYQNDQHISQFHKSSGEKLVVFPPVVDDCLTWQRLIDTRSEVRQRFNRGRWDFAQQVIRAAIDQSAGRYIVGLPNLYGPYDTLAALREPLALCLDLIDCPDMVQQAAWFVLAELTTVRDIFWRQIRAAGFGSAGWIPAYSEEAVGLLSCDFWGLLAPSTVETLIMPIIEQEMEPFNYSLFHLDGPLALNHLDLLLNLPKLDAIQWDFGPGQGPAVQWLELYRRILAADKSVQVLAEDVADALTVLQALGPKGIWLTIKQPFISRTEAEYFLNEIATNS